jgi:hypothetical protein
MKELAKKTWQFKRWVFENLKVFFLFENQGSIPKPFKKKTIHPCWGK